MANEVTGLKEAVAALGEVEKKVRKKLLRKAATTGGKIVLKQAKVNVIRVSGLLARSLGHKTKSYRGTTFVDIIGARKGFEQTIKGKKTDPSKYASLVEGGTRPHSLASGSRLARLTVGKKESKPGVGQGTGRMHPGAKAKPFLIPARQSTSAAVMAAMTDVIATGIQDTAKGGK